MFCQIALCAKSIAEVDLRRTDKYDATIDLLPRLVTRQELLLAVAPQS
jgi:hypothetical protein